MHVGLSAAVPQWRTLQRGQERLEMRGPRAQQMPKQVLLRSPVPQTSFLGRGSHARAAGMPQRDAGRPLCVRIAEVFCTSDRWKQGSLVVEQLLRYYVVPVAARKSPGV